MHRIAIGVALALALGFSSMAAHAASGAIAPPAQPWSFQGMFGTFDKGALRRGFQIYKDVCGGCHSLRQVSYRDLSAIGYTSDEIKAIAAEYDVLAGPDEEGYVLSEDGDFRTRPARPAEKFVPPYANEQMARAANAGSMPPDLSLMVKARPNGADYLYALLTSYEETVSPETLQKIFALETQKREHAYDVELKAYEEAVKQGQKAEKPEKPKPIQSIEDMEIQESMYFNAYFDGYQIAMTQPLYDGSVEYEDGAPATIEQHAKDIVTFLAWTASPELEDRKRMGIKTLIFLVILTGMIYAVKRRIWAKVH